MKTNLKYLKSFRIFEEYVKSGINVENFVKELKSLLEEIGAEVSKEEIILNKEEKIMIKDLKEEMGTKQTTLQRKLKNLLNDIKYKKYREKITLFKQKWLETM